MLRKTLLTAAALAALSMPAYAFQCPSDMAKIDAAMQTTDLSADQKAKAQALRQKGEALHKAGKHQESVDTLAQAKEMLGVQ
ncbi:hypothetical protein HW532_04630 [Kaustia mangrovi]|uniref:Uncharacterized protein n=1 Tax=Kaustia mangrovi TaxID=2593653 RepID=A0A7S8C291_9HYPH|nr:hypothetical protein [Kaustia mangrovi]QPC42055.1 hypothetical protein HW532_04630 [Kaustia mangrovi]